MSLRAALPREPEFEEPQWQGQLPALVDVHRLTGRCLSNADPEWSIFRRGTRALGHCCCCPFSDVGQISGLNGDLFVVGQGGDTEFAGAIVAGGDPVGDLQFVHFLVFAEVVGVVFDFGDFDRYLFAVDL